MRSACQEHIVPLGMRAKHSVAVTTPAGPPALLNAWSTDPCAYFSRRLNDACRMEIGSGKLCMAPRRQDHQEVGVRAATFIPSVVVIAAVIEDGGDNVTHAAS